MLVKSIASFPRSLRVLKLWLEVHPMDEDDPDDDDGTRRINDFFASLACFTELRELSWSYYEDFALTSCCVDSLRQLHHLERLSVEYLTSAALDAVADSCPQLSHLELSRMYDEMGGEADDSLLLRMPSLRSLKIANGFPAVVAKMETLEHLRLCARNDAEWELLATAVSCNPLKSLTVSRCGSRGSTCAADGDG
eukprot:PLAT11685.18.p1 GENE.PLAT11685.18~~PLAT11685.18.p1  ORF type:complete len:195 (-),score=24.06 PLAT11685.18:310-894(-)